MLVLLYTTFLHLCAIYLFTSGFLLTRLSLPNVSTQIEPTILPTHSKLILIIIDALRFDFISPNPPGPPHFSEFYHNVLTLPAELTEKHPGRSFIFNAYADPPTATLQRLKAITTGSLPTFVDFGANFDSATGTGGGQVGGEDNIIGQFRRANKTMAFMGDDTWISIFPDSFNSDMAFPFDSFDVEDLHSVDEGVLRHIFPLLSPNSSSSTTPDLLVAHMLGLDHTGHRLSPKHPSARAKLLQYNVMLSRVVELMQDDTLLVVMGDHGMDESGDHGGDSQLEVSSAVWLYSKTEIVNSSIPLPSVQDEAEDWDEQRPWTELFPSTKFPHATTEHRQIQQIDLVPTLSMMLGLPIPFGSLGSAIGELLWRDNPEEPTDQPDGEKQDAGVWGQIIGCRTTPDTTTSESKQSSSPRVASQFLAALRTNANQIHSFLEAYRASSAGSELDGGWSELEDSWQQIVKAGEMNAYSDKDELHALQDYTRLALSTCRDVWARFNAVKMVAGLVVLFLSILASSLLVHLSTRPSASALVSSTLLTSVRFIAGGCVLAALFASSSPAFMQSIQMDGLDLVLFLGSTGGCVGIMVAAQRARMIPSVGDWLLSPRSAMSVVILIIHALSFLSNSFILWESRMVLWLAGASVFVAWGLTAVRALGTAPSNTMNGDSTVINSLASVIQSLRRRIRELSANSLLYIGAYLVLMRTMSASNVCREELLQWDCTATFWEPFGTPAGVPVLEVLGFISAVILPTIIWRLFLRPPSVAPSGTVPESILTKYWPSIFLRPALVVAWGVWVLEKIEGHLTTDLPIAFGVTQDLPMNDIASMSWATTFLTPTFLRPARTFGAWFVVVWITLGAFAWWAWPVGVALSIREPPAGEDLNVQAKASKSSPPKATVMVSNLPNALGSPSLVFLLIPFSFVVLSSQLTAQLAMAAGLVAMMIIAKASDDVDELEVSLELDATLASNSPTIPKHTLFTFTQTPPLALLALALFYATGHQHTFVSVQWKTAFILSSTVWLPFSIITPVLNTLGMFLLAGVAAAVIGVWGKATGYPMIDRLVEKGSRSDQTQDENAAVDEAQRISDYSLQSTLPSMALQVYFSSLLLGTALSAAILRRHLMVWKVFAPRFMAAVLELILVDVGVLLGAFAVGRARRYSKSIII